MRFKILFVLFLFCGNAQSKLEIDKDRLLENFESNNIKAIYEISSKLINAERNNTESEIEFYKNIYLAAINQFVKSNDYSKVYSTAIDVYRSNVFNTDRKLTERITLATLSAFDKDIDCEKKSAFLTTITKNGILDTDTTYSRGRIIFDEFIQTSIANYELNQACIAKTFQLLLDIEYEKAAKSKKYKLTNAIKSTNVLFEKIEGLDNKYSKLDYLKSVNNIFIKLLKNNNEAAAIDYISGIQHKLPYYNLEEILLYSEDELLSFTNIPDEIVFNKINLIAKYLGSDLWPFKSSKDELINKLINIKLKDDSANDYLLVFISEPALRSLKNKDHKEASKLYARILKINSSKTAKYFEPELFNAFKLLIAGFKIRAALYMGDIQTAAKIHGDNISEITKFFNNPDFSKANKSINSDTLLVLMKPYLEYDMLMGHKESAKEIIEIATKNQEIDLSLMSDQEYLLANKEKFKGSSENFLYMMKSYYKFIADADKVSDVDLAISILIPGSYNNSEVFFSGLFSAVRFANIELGTFYLQVFKDNIYYYHQSIAYPIYCDLYSHFEEAFNKLRNEDLNEESKKKWKYEILEKAYEDFGLIYFLENPTIGYSEKVYLLNILFEISIALEKKEEAYAYANIYLDTLIDGAGPIKNKNVSIDFKQSQSEKIEKIIQFFFDNDNLIEARKAISIFKEQSFLELMEKQGDSMRGVGLKSQNHENTISIKINSINAQLALVSQRIGEARNPDDIAKLNNLRSSLANELKTAYKSSIAPEVNQNNTSKPNTTFTNGHAYLDYIVKNDNLTIIYQDNNKIRKISQTIDTKKFAATVQSLSTTYSEINDQGMQTSAALIYETLFSPIVNIFTESNISTLHIRANSYLASIPLKYVISIKNNVFSDVNVIYQGISNPESKKFNFGEKSSLFATTKRYGKLPSLTSANIEINYIYDSYKNKFSQKNGSRKFINENFSFEKFTSEFASNTNVIHIASHYIPDRKAGGLLLGTGQFVTPKQIWNELSLSPSSKLITISTCESGLFNDQGQSLEDLPNVFLSKGATFVVATLWKISDNATADFMRLFYDVLMISGDPPTALNLTQSSFADGNFSRLGARFNLDSDFNSKHQSTLKNYSKPFYWAGFQLISSN